MSEQNILWVLIIVLLCVPTELYLLMTWSPFFFKYGIRIRRHFVSCPTIKDFDLAPATFERAWREMATIPIRMTLGSGGTYIFSDSLSSKSPPLFGIVHFNHVSNRIEIEGKASPLIWLGLLTIFLVILPAHVGTLVWAAYLAIWYSIQRKRVEAIGRLFAEVGAQSKAG